MLWHMQIQYRKIDCTQNVEILDGWLFKGNRINFENVTF